MSTDLFKEEFVELIRQHQGIIFKVSRMYCNERICRDDLFQDILLQLWRSFPSYDRKRKFSSWMYSVALNTAISQLRKDSRRKIESIQEVPLAITDCDDNEAYERTKFLYEAINRLSKAEKSIMLLYLDECTYEEIAEIIGITVSNVGVKINRIKKKLKEYLKELGYGL